MAQARVFWKVGSDNYIDLVGLKNDLSGEYYDDASVIVSVRTRRGVAVTGLTNIVAAHVVDTTGPTTTYRAFVDDTVTLPIGLYEATVRASKNGIVLTEYAPISVEKG